MNPDGVTGIPIRHIEFGSSDQVTSTTELTDISRQNIPDATFAVPSGFQKEAFGPFGRGR
ncbi:MAG: hypothetical protein ACRD1V_17815 [Vicinamibacterales bacterium]